MFRVLIGETFQLGCPGLCTRTFVFSYVHTAVGLKCNVKLFADNTSFFTVVGDRNTAAINMNHDLDSVSHWAQAGRMSFNPHPLRQLLN